MINRGLGTSFILSFPIACNIFENMNNKFDLFYRFLYEQNSYLPLYCITLFKQFCFAYFVYSHYHCLALRMCIYVYLVCVKVCSQVETFLQKYLDGIEHFQSNCASAILLFLGLDLHFQGQNFWHFIIFSGHLANGEKQSKDHYRHQIGNQLFVIEWSHCEYCGS